MKFCIKCGSQLQDDDIFCTKCGCKAPQMEPKMESQTQTINSTINEEQSFENEQSENISSGYEKHKLKLMNYKSLIAMVSIVLFIAIVTVICFKTIPYKCFDIKDDDLFEILDELGVNVSLSTLKHNELEELDGFDKINTDTTIYKITVLEETGILVLSHGFSGHIRCIMVCFDDDTVAAAVISALASELDYSFSTSTAMNSVLLDGEIYTSDKYTVMKKDLSSELSGIFLTPKEHLEYSIKSILSN